jgi:hypothetical protein
MTKFTALALSLLSLSAYTAALPAETLFARGENDTITPHSFYDLQKNVPPKNYVPKKE